MQNYKGIMLYTFILVPSFMKISMTVLKLYSGHNFPVKDSKGPNSAKKCRWSYADCLILFYISTMFHEISWMLSELWSRQEPWGTARQIDSHSIFYRVYHSTLPLFVVGHKIGTLKIITIMIVKIIQFSMQFWVVKMEWQKVQTMIRLFLKEKTANSVDPDQTAPSW